MRRWMSLLSAFALVAVCVAQQSPSDISDVATQAHIIFRGTVLAVVAETPRAPGEIAAARITVRVEDGIRGAATGETLTFRQWNVAADEYRLGETMVLFLHAPSDELGLTSPVGGRAGHRRLEEIPAEALDSLRTAPGPQRPARVVRR